MFEVFRTIN